MHWLAWVVFAALAIVALAWSAIVIVDWREDEDSQLPYVSAAVVLWALTAIVWIGGHAV